MAPTSRPAIQDSVEIAQPPGDVWSVLTNWEMAGDWLPHMASCQGPTEMRVGDELSFLYHDQPGSATVEVLDPGRRLVIRRTNGPVEAVFTYEVEGTDVGTTVRLSADIETSQLRLVRPLLRRGLVRTDRDQLQRLKAHLEPDHGA